MSRKENRWDNAVAESFFSSLKKERIKKTELQEPRIGTNLLGELHRELLQSDTTSQSCRRGESRAI